MTADTGELSPVDRVATLIAGGDLAERVARYVTASSSAATRRAHASDWRTFTAWCSARRVCPLPAETGTVAGYLADRAAVLRPSSLQRAASSISVAHRAAGFASPVRTPAVAVVLAGIRRTHGTAASRKSPLVVDELRLLVAQLGDDAAGVRDRAVLLLGFSAALRRSELAALNEADLEFIPAGVLVHVRRSKTDQAGEGRVIAVGYGANAGTCPVIALRCWLERARIDAGPLFRAIDRHGRIHGGLSGRAIACIVQRRVASLGLDARRFGGHSLRAGFATSAAASGVAESEIADVTGHRSVAVLRSYVRRGLLATTDISRRVGL